MQAIGLSVKSIADILALTVDMILDRRLQTVVHKKGLAQTTKHARQLIVHKKVLVAGNVMNKPSYLIPVDEESSLSLRFSEKKKPVEQVKEVVQ